jgi:hypothetical protein
MRYALQDHKRNEEIINKQQIPQITKFIEKYRRKWKEHIDRMNSERIPKIL